jgi:alkaline phosphatase
MRISIILLIIMSLVAMGFRSTQAPDSDGLKYVILMIGDGMGSNQVRAANAYTGDVPGYQDWSEYWVATYPAGGSYDPQLYWSDFYYALDDYTDSAAAATALYAGVKTADGRICVDADGSQRLITIADMARESGKAVGAVTSVYISHATPGAWYAHNLARSNGYAIADEGLWGDPNTTGDPDQPYYGGGQGPTLPPVDVIIGAGHPDWNGANYVNQTMLTELRSESAAQSDFELVERESGSYDGGSRLLASASNPSTLRLVGLFGGTGGNLEYRLADGSGQNLENPSLAEMTASALVVLDRDPDGFVLMVEGGAIDWASHSNNMDRLLGEQIAFNQAVTVVADWVDDPTNGSSWFNTMVIVTADHETGYLTAGPDVSPKEPLGDIDSHSISLEKVYSPTGRRASWEDSDDDSQIDAGEYVYWAWNTGGHSNSLVPLYVKGIGADNFTNQTLGTDPVRGIYIDNTAGYTVISELMNSMPIPTPSPTAASFYLPFLLR